MRRRSLVLALAAASLAAVPALVGSAVADPPELAPGTHPGASDNVVYTYDRGHYASRGGAKPASRVLLSYHGGPVMTSSVTQAIFWGPKWTNSSVVGDKVVGIDSWYSGFGGSNYAGTNTEYTDGSGVHVGTTSTYNGHVIDTNPASGGGSTSAILAEVSRAITNPQPNGYYPVYTDLPRGNAGYCAWHSAGTTTSGVHVQFAFFWSLDGDPGCDPQDTSGLHSEGLAALANVSGHELSEAMTDPSLNAWYDGSGSENGDKCAWTFGGPLVTLSNHTSWKIQGEWSNNAYNTGTGYPNSSGQKGCLGGL
jgi:hypothetical protein